MRGLTRIGEPEILATKGAVWLDALKQSGKTRPEPKKYGNPAIRSALNSISFHKCFYCEYKLKGVSSEIDHHIEVSIDLDLSYIWTNLYLSCTNCNNKINHIDIPITDALDPCIDDDNTIEAHITFNDEMITANNNSNKGLNTIKKYKLATDELDLLRLKHLQQFATILDSIRQAQINDGGRTPTEDEINVLTRFKQADQPFSMMFKVLLAKKRILKSHFY